MAKKASKTADKSMAQAAMTTLAKTFNPSCFRFFQATQEQTEALIAEGKRVVAFRNLAPVVLQKNQNYVSTNSSHMSEKDAVKPDEVSNRSKPNPGSRDAAYLDGDKNMLVLVGSIKLIPRYFTLDISDNPAYKEYHQEFVNQYLADGHMPELMRRYLSNIVNGRLLWRNKFGYSRKTVIDVRTGDEDPLQRFVIQKPEGAEFERLVDLIQTQIQKKGLVTTTLEIAMIIEVGYDAEVYPSQLFVQEGAVARMREDGDKKYSRLLANRNWNGAEQVIFGADKIGNALRTIDSSYAEGDDLEPIAVELYGAVMTQRVAHRYENKTSYFDLVLKKRYADMTTEERHYIMAVWMKGGSLGFAQDKKEA